MYLAIGAIRDPCTTNRFLRPVTATHAALLRPATRPPHPGQQALAPGLGPVLGSVIHVRGRTPVVTRIVFARLADGGGRR
jgi:hypothetical protein